MDVTIVIDVDDTISTNIRRLPYSECKPRQDVIDKINRLHDDLGYRIVLYTARGMVSCEGDLERIIKKNKAVLEDWLERHGVHYDELVFGKPLGDMYVDDKAMDVNDFVRARFGELHGGGSNKALHRIGHIVKKDLGTPEETERFKDWVEDCKGACLFPRVVSYLYSAVYMDYVEGTNLCDDFTTADFLTLIGTIERFGENKKSSFDLGPHIENLEKNRSDNAEMNGVIDLCKAELLRHREAIEQRASFCHGDAILSNIIKTGHGLYFIDPRYFRGSSTYLFDYGKLRMSLMGYEKRFEISDKTIDAAFLDSLDRHLKTLGIYEPVLAITLMHICRLYRYKKDEQKGVVLDMAREALREIIWRTKR